MDTCLTEKRWLAISPRPLTANGGQYGQVTITSTLDFKVKQTIRLKSSAESTLELEVKRVISLTELEVGPKGNIADREDISAYLVVDGATIEAPEQPRAAIPYQQHENAVYAEEPIIAKRVIMVDRLGCYYDSDNPLPVTVEQITIDNVSVQLDHEGDDFDSVRIGDGTDLLEINPDGSINIVSGIPQGTPINTFNDVTAVVASTPITVVSFTASSQSFLQRISCSGTNIAEWTIRLNGLVIDKKRTYFPKFNTEFNWQAYGTLGESLSPGDVIIVEVLHNRPSVGDFEARIQALEF